MIYEKNSRSCDCGCSRNGCVHGYSSMKPHTKNELKKDFRKTFNHMDDVKEELGNVRADMTQMARNLKNEM